MVRARARLARDDRAGAMQALEQATALDDRLVNAHMLLASFYEEASQYDKAIEQYRHILSAAPGHLGALNNLAYALAVHRTDGLHEALTLAQRAHATSPGNPSITDTLAWVLHLSGDDGAARPLIAAAARDAQDVAPIQLHAAVIEVANGAFDAAARDFARALELDPQIEQQPEAQQVRAALKRVGK